MNSFSIIFLAPANAVKARITANYIFNKNIIDHSRSLIILDMDPSACDWTPDGVKSVAVTDRSLRQMPDECVGREFDFLISCGWGTKIVEDALSIPRIAALNCHSSYLPDYKGGSVYDYYWANCEKSSGASIHLMTNSFDQGNIIAQQKFSILTSDTPRSILIRASEMTGPLLAEAMLLSSMGSSGFLQSGGRYFTKVGRWRLRAHRLINRAAVFFGLPRWLTPHKEI